ncbi:MAG: VWA domain-containing protein [Oscillibacter sp.]|nr:VWA domain-containing protein [Oscillibacter sp.]
MLRRLPVYLMVDCSGSMKGDPIKKARAGLDSILSALLADPAAVRCVYLSVITFGNEAKTLTPLTPLLDFKAPDLSVPPDGGGSFLGAAFELLEERVLQELRKDDWPPLVFLLTDGKPSDTANYKRTTRRVQAGEIREIWPQNIIACVVGSKADPKALHELTENVLLLNALTTSEITNYISDFFYDDYDELFYSSF